MKDIATLKAEQEKYTTLWPDYCRICGGSGAVVCEDSVDYGSTTTTMQTLDNCPACVDEGKCPRCGKNLQEDGDLKCEWCGWNELSDPAPMVEEPLDDYALDIMRWALAMNLKIRIL